MGGSKGTIRQQLGSVGRMVRRQLNFYEHLRARVDSMELPGDDPLRAAVERAWESLYALNLALESYDGPEGEGGDASTEPGEACSACGRVMGLKQVAHVFDDRCVCLGCYCKLKTERDRVEVERLAAARPPTEQQLAFARGLGLRVPPDVTYQRLSEMVRAYTTRPAPPEVQHEAVAMGIAEAEASTLAWQALDRLLDDRRLTYRWVFSVCRHMLGAQWVQFADCRLPHNVVLPILNELATRPESLDAIRQHGGDPPPASTADDADPADEWFTFAADPMSNGTGAVYKETRQLIERESWAYLPHLPRKAGPNRRRRR